MRPAVVRTALGLAALLAMSWAPAHAADWVQAPVTAAESIVQPSGWRCISEVALPAPLPARFAACRRTGPQPSPELELLLIGESSAPKVLAHLADASRAVMHLFVAGAGCSPASKAPCGDALVLVDQSDESSCYGTEVWLRAPGKAPRSLGFIDEFRPEADQGACIGPFARVSARGTDLRIEVPAPLARLRPDGSVRALGGAAVSYRVSPAQRSMRRVMR